MDYYNWFYSALAQSLAALVGIAGVFAIFRLQIQHSFTEEAFSNLRTYVFRNNQRGDDLKITAMDHEELLTYSAELNNFLASRCTNREKEINDLRNKMTEQNSYVINEQIGRFQSWISNDRILMTNLTMLKTKCIHGNTEKQIISGKAFYIVRNLFALFILSMFGLYFAKDLVSLFSLSALGRLAQLTALLCLLFIGVDMVNFFKRSLRGDFLSDAFKDVERKKK